MSLASRLPAPLALAVAAVVALAGPAGAAQPRNPAADPTLGTVRVVPGSVTTTAGAVSATVEVVVKDPSSVAGGVGVDLVSNEGPDLTGSATSPVQQLGDGTQLWDVAVQLEQGFPTAATSAAYTVHQVTVSRNDGGADVPFVPSSGGGDQLALTVAHAADPDAPTYVGASVVPSTLSTIGTGSADVLVGIHATDAVSGYASFTATLKGASTSFPVAVTTSDPQTDPRTGPVTDSTLSSTVHIPEGTPAGTYTLTDITLVDGYGNGSPAPLTPAGAPTLTIGSHPDGGATLVSATGPVAAVDSTHDVTHVVEQLRITDVGGSFHDGRVSLTTSDCDTTQGSTAFSAVNRISGDAHDGIYQVSVFLPHYAQAGTWRLGDVVLNDTYNTTTEVSCPDVADDQLTTTTDGHFTVTRTDDATDPVIAGLTATPITAWAKGDGSTTAGIVVSVHVTDTGAGIPGGAVSVDVHDQGQDDPSAVDLSLTSGTRLDGYWTGLYSATYRTGGAITFHLASATDAAGNPSAASSLTAPVTPTSTGTADTTKPVVSAVVRQAATVTLDGYDPDADRQVGTGLLTLTVGDTGTGGGASSGIGSATVTYTDAAGSSFSGDATTFAPDGTSIDLGVPLSVSSRDVGLAHLSGITVTDGAGNETDLDASQVAAITAASSTDLTITGDQDTTPPTVTADSRIGSGPVDVSTAPGGVDVSLSTSDDRRVAGLQAHLIGPNGTNVYASEDVSSETASMAGLILHFQVPTLVPAGTYVLEQVVVSDIAGNGTTYAAADLPTPVSVTVADTRVDVTAPQIAAGAGSVVVTPGTTVDSSSGEKLLVIEAHVLDTSDGTVGHDGSGFAYGGLTLSRTGGGSLGANLTLIGGTPADGWVQAAVAVPQYLPSGSYAISLDLLDQLGNENATVTPAAGQVSSVSLTGLTDSTAPHITGFSLQTGSTSVDVTAGDAEVYGTLSYTDTGSGFSSGAVSLTAPGSPEQTLSLGCQAGFSATTGTPQDGTCTVYGVVPQGSRAGVWTVTAIDANDGYGNFVDLPADGALPSPGATLTVVDAAADTTPPTLVSFTHDATADTRTSDAVVHVAAEVSDASGVDDVSYRLNPPGQAAQTLDLDRLDATHFSGTFTIKQGFPSATFTIDHVVVTDHVGNSSTSDPTPDTVTVTGPACTTSCPAPVTGLTLTPGAAGQLNASWTAGANDVSYDVSLDGATPTSQTSTSAVFIGLSPTSHTVSVSGRNANGVSTAVTASATPNAAAAAPTGLTGTANGTAITWSWTAPAGSGITGYQLTLSPVPPAGQPAVSSGTSQTVSGLPASTTYSATVHAITGAGAGAESTSAQATTGAPAAGAPAAPAGVSVVPASTTAVVSWTAPAGTVSGYLVTLTPAPAGGEPAAVTGTALLVSGLSPSTSYTVTVTAANLVGTGPASPGVAFRTTAAVPVLKAWTGLTLTLPKKIPAKTKVLVSAKLSGHATSRTIALQQLVGKTWKTVATLKWNKKTKRWEAKVSFKGKGSLRISVKADAKHAATTSKAKSFKAV